MIDPEALSTTATALADWAENEGRPVTDQELRAALAELGHPRSLVTGVIAECIVKGRLQVDEQGNFTLGNRDRPDSSRAPLPDARSNVLLGDEASSLI